MPHAHNSRLIELFLCVVYAIYFSLMIYLQCVCVLATPYVSCMFLCYAHKYITALILFSKHFLSFLLHVVCG